MLTFIIVIALLVIIKFLYDLSQQNIKIGKEGGMSQKYKILISFFLQGHENCKIVQESSDSIILGVSNGGGTTTFHFVQTFSNLTIQWNMKSPLFGKHTLEWVLPEYMDQEKMAKKISEELIKYQTNVVSSSPFRDVI